MPSVTRIAVIDDHPLYRAGLRQALGAAPDLEIVAEGCDAGDALQIAQTNEQDIILLDINIPGGGIEAGHKISCSQPDTKLVFLTNSESDANVLTVMEMGAHGYIIKGVSGAELIEVLRLIHGGQYYVTPNLAADVLRKICRSNPPNSSSRRDVQPGTSLGGSQLF